MFVDVYTAGKFIVRFFFYLILIKFVPKQNCRDQTDMCISVV